MPFSITPEVSQKIRELQPLVAALNAMSDSYEIATDHYGEALDELPEDAEPHHMDEVFDEQVRELAGDTREDLFRASSALARQYGLELRFNRIDGKYVLLEDQTQAENFGASAAILVRQLANETPDRREDWSEVNDDVLMSTYGEYQALIEQAKAIVHKAHAEPGRTGPLWPGVKKFAELQLRGTITGRFPKDEE